jgi:beta-N-acetylhexosaminidase
MSAHVVFEALDPNHPATLSDAVIEPLLRNELGFQGVVVSDDLEMRAIGDHYGIEDAVVRAVRAGCDQLLICHRVDLQEAAHRGLVKAVESGALPRSRLEAAAGRVAELKRRFSNPHAVDPAEVISELEGPERKSRHAALLDDLTLPA